MRHLTLSKKNIWVVVAVIFLSSCTTELKYHMYNHQFLTPETKGEFLKGDVSIAYQQTQKVVVAEAVDSWIFNWPTTANTTANISKSASLTIPINVGLLKRLDFFNQTTKWGLKYQFLGAPENERAEGYKAAVALSTGYDHETDNSQTFSNGSTTRTYNTDMNVNSYALSMLWGYRKSETQLFYLNLFRENYKYKGSLTSNQFAAINVSGKSYNQGAELGFSHTEKEAKHPIIFRLELGVADSKLDNQISSTVGTGSADVGWSW